MTNRDKERMWRRLEGEVDAINRLVSYSFGLSKADRLSDSEHHLRAALAYTLHLQGKPDSQSEDISIHACSKCGVDVMVRLNRIREYHCPSCTEATP